MHVVNSPNTPAGVPASRDELLANRSVDRHEHATHSQLAGSVRHPEFTVGSAMRWLGHDCPDRQCWLPIDTLSASVWFLLSGQRSYAFRPKTRVLVDLSITGADLRCVHQVINEVNWCTRRDAIEVGYLPSTRGGRPTPSPTPVSLLKHYRPTRLDEGADPPELDLAAITKGSQATTHRP
jgi:hypothetical protein